MLRQVFFHDVLWTLPRPTQRTLIRTLRPSVLRGADAYRHAPVTPESVSLAPLLSTRSVFVHVPKCAGVSVAYALYGCRAMGHWTLRHFAVALTKKEYDAAFKFAFVRNPYARLASAFSFLKQGGQNARDAAFADEHLRGVDTFEQFVMAWLDARKVWYGYHLSPQTHFVRLNRWHASLDFLGYVEHLARDFGYVRSRVQPRVVLPELNVGDSGNHAVADLYSDEMARKVHALYRRDFEALGYDPDPTRPLPDEAAQRVATATHVEATPTPESAS